MCAILSVLCGDLPRLFELTFVINYLIELDKYQKINRKILARNTNPTHSWD